MNIEAPKPRNLYIYKDVNQEAILELSKAIIEINEHDDHLFKVYKAHGLSYVQQPIKIYIDSYGGYIYQTFGLIGLMEKSVTPIHTFVTGCAMSAAFLILIHGHKRFCYQHSTVLYHQISQRYWGKVADWEIAASEMKRMQEKVENLTLVKTGISAKRLEKNYKTKTDWYMSADEALKYGVIDEIIQ